MSEEVKDTSKSTGYIFRRVGYINNLPAQKRVVAMLYFYEKLSKEQIAVAMSMSVDRVSRMINAFQGVVDSMEVNNG
ncbi:hypothetical protein M0R04_05600 [Candidatus Dojkabacteria bacterium]|jgi:DNA-directed RNA polymerase specialized sigma subunit|nr:hypothetical protein [Candidatus Dojkabacteria bacterium]